MDPDQSESRRHAGSLQATLLTGRKQCWIDLKSIVNYGVW